MIFYYFFQIIESVQNVTLLSLISSSSLIISYRRQTTTTPDNSSLGIVVCSKGSDGSELGYGACAYLRLVDTEGKVNCSLVFGKSGLAPLEQTTIPRLELSGVVVVHFGTDFFSSSGSDAFQFNHSSCFSSGIVSSHPSLDCRHRSCNIRVIGDTSRSGLNIELIVEVMLRLVTGCSSSFTLNFILSSFTFQIIPKARSVGTDVFVIA
jgi:hypothetical protein